jgi:hypothetical protein
LEVEVDLVVEVEVHVSKVPAVAVVAVHVLLVQEEVDFKEVDFRGEIIMTD